MKKSKVVTGVLTAALAMSLVPTPAIADALEGAGQQLEAQATQVANETTEPASDPKVSEKPATIAITTIITAPDTISYTLKKADGTTYEGVAPIGTDANMDNFTDSYWDGSHWIFDIPLQVFETPEQYGLTVPAGFEGDYKLDPASSSATVKFMYVDNAWVPATGAGATLVFVEEAADPEPTVAFDINDVLDVDNAVHYYASGSSKHATAITSADNVVSVGDPVYHSGGTKPYWTVEVTLKTEGVTAADYGVPTGYLGQTDPAEWVVDETADNKFTTSFTLREGQSSWRATTSGYALLHFVHEQAEPVAPAFDVADELNTYGTVKYDLIHTDGTSSKDNGTTIRQSANVEKVGEAYLDADGNWAVDVTLSGNATPDDYNVPNWQMHDDEYELDADASKLTMTFRTNGVNGTTWYCSGADRASLVFVGKAAEPSVAFDADAALAAYHTVHYTATTQTIENSTSIGKSENIESIGAPVYDEAADRWTVEVTLKSEGVTAADYGVLEGFLGSDPSGWVIDPAAQNDLTVTFVLEAGSDAWAMADGGYALLHFVEKAEPVAPVFDVVDELDTVGTVSYEVRNADGSTYDDGGFGAILSEGNIEKVGEARQEADGTWAVDVTLRSNLTPSDLGVDDWKLGDGEYELDPSSKLTLTFRTLSADGTEWYVLGDENRASVIFVEKAAGENPDDQKPGDEQKPGDQQPGDESKDPAGEKNDPNTEGENVPGDVVPETGDSTSIAFAGVAVAGAVAVAAGIAIERRRSIER